MIEPEKLEKISLTPPHLIEYNSAVLYNLIREDGGEPEVYPIAKDEEEDIKQTILKACGECDLILLNAGSGYGKRI